MPAALTAPWMPPKHSVAAARARLTSASLVTSVRTKWAFAPSSFAATAPVSAFTSRITTLPPAPTNARAAAPPSPEAPPVTRNVLPSMRMGLLRVWTSVHEELQAPHERSS